MKSINSSLRNLKNSSKVFSYLTLKQKFSFWIIIGLMLLTTIFELISLGMVIPLLSSILTIDISSNLYLSFLYEILGSSSSKDFIIKIVLILITVFLIKGALITFTMYKQFSFAWSLQQYFRQLLYEHYLKRDYKYFLNTSSSKIISHVISQTDQFTNLFIIPIMFIVLEMFIIFFLFIFLILYAYTGVLLFLISLGTIIILYFIFGGARLNKLGTEWKYHIQEITKFIQQSLEGIKETILYDRKNFFFNKIRFHSAGLANPMKIYLTAQQIPRIFLEVFSMMALGVFVLIMVNYNEDYNEGLLKIGVFAAAAFKILPSVNRVLYSMQSIKFSNAVVENMLTQLGNLESKFYSNKKSKNEKIYFSNKIEVKNVSFSYKDKKDKENQMLFKNLNFEIFKGDKIGIKGQTGTGKSTFIDLMSGLLEPTTGKILSDGIPIQENLEEWRKKISYVPQFSYLIEDTILNNITFFHDKKDNVFLDKIVNDCELYQFVSNLNDGINTFIGERGTQISGGQKQRIALARALYRMPEILILDESLSALDSNTSTKIVENIILNSKITIIFVSHNDDSLKFCNKIYQLKNGDFIINK